MSGGRDSIVRLLGLLAVLAAACAAGALPSVLSLEGTLALAAAGLVALVLIGLRRAVSAESGPSAPPQVDRFTADADADAIASGEAGDLRLARRLFYLGCLLVAEPKFRPAGGLTVAEVAFIAAFAICLFAVIRGRSVPVVPAPMLLVVGCFVFGGAVSSFDAQSPPSSVIQLAHAIYVVLLWPIVAAMVLRTRRHFITALTLLTVSAAVEGVAALAQAMGIEVLGLVSEGSRMTGFTPHPNDLGGATAIALVVALMLATLPSANTTVIRRAARWLAVVLIAMGVTLSGSITAMAACGAGILLWLTWPSARTGARLAVAAAIIISLGAIAITQNGTGTLSPVQRLAQVANPTAVSGGSLQDRVSLVEQAWPRIISDPLVGAGLDVADSDLPIVSGTYDTSYQIHGLPVAAWYQSGIFGMLGLVGLLLVVGVLGWRSIRASVDELDVVIGVTLLAAFMGFVVEAMSVPMVFQQYSWIMAALMFAWSRNVEARASEIYFSDVTARAVPSTLSSTGGEQLVTSR